MRIKEIITRKFAKKYNFEDKNAFVFCFCMIAVPFAFFLLFWVYVNINSIGLAFLDVHGKFTMGNFSTVFKAFVGEDMYGWSLAEILGRTILLWFCVNCLCVLPGLFSSYVLYKKIFGAYFFRVVFMVPAVLAGIVWVMIMKYMVTVGGPVISIAEKLGWKIPLDVQYNGFLGSSYSFATILLLNVWPHLVGFNIIITGAYARIPTELLEVGKLDGLSFIKEFFLVSVPLVWPTIVVSLITNMATIFTFDGGVFLYTKGTYNTGTMGFYLYYMTYLISGSADVMTPFYGYPAAVGVLLTVITVPVVFLAKFVLGKAVETVEY